MSDPGTGKYYETTRNFKFVELLRSIEEKTFTNQADA